MKHIVFAKTRTVREVTKRQILTGTHGTGFTTVPDGHEELYYETTIDLDLLNRMAHSAAKNKSGKSHDGALSVRIVERRRIP